MSWRASPCYVVQISPSYHCLPSQSRPGWDGDESCPGKIFQMMMDDEDCWGGGATDHPNLVIWLSNCINFWIQSSPMSCHCPGSVLVIFSWILKSFPQFHSEHIPGTIKKIFIVYGPDSGWCCISSFHLLFKSLLNIPRGPTTARISLH